MECCDFFGTVVANTGLCQGIWVFEVLLETAGIDSSVLCSLSRSSDLHACIKFFTAAYLYQKKRDSEGGRETGKGIILVGKA